MAKPMNARLADKRKYLRAIVAPYSRSVTARSLWQIANTLLPLIALFAVMYASISVSYWLPLAFTVPAACLLVRLFIIQHDCGHGSFFPSRAANVAMGCVASLFTLTPFANWRRQHMLHHGTWNNLDRRQSGSDIYSSCLTVAEYRALGFWKRVGYRLLQHPVTALIVLPPLVFLLLYRIPFDTPRSWTRERRSVWLTNVALVAVYGSLGWFLGWRSLVIVQLPVLSLGAIIGAWMFSLQHRSERTFWFRADQWDAITASLLGSSFLRLPNLLHWLTGNIGFHHIHHLDARIPNYRLRQCHEADAMLRVGPELSFWQGLRAWRYALWDEELGRMVPLSHARKMRRPAPRAPGGSRIAVR
jgi:acyl-lipid omega-6 desaturase (Delta-12 desaturase)